MSAYSKGGIDRLMEMYKAPFARMMGIEVVSVSPDEVVCSMELRPEMLNSMGRGHGAAVYALIDHTFAIAANLVRDCTGQSSSISYFRPASGPLTAVCRPINRSRSLEVFDVRAYDEGGKLVAAATCTAFVIGREGSRWIGSARIAESPFRRTASPAPNATGRCRPRPNPNGPAGSPRAAAGAARPPYCWMRYRDSSVSSVWVSCTWATGVRSF